MTVVLYCGGRGLRLREGLGDVPKPLAPIGAEPILRHLMRYYAHHGHRHFVLCLGHQAEDIVQYFATCRERAAMESRGPDATRVVLSMGDLGRWVVDLVRTEPAACVGERLRAVRAHVAGAVFLSNYVDGLSDLHLPTFLDGFAASGAVVGLVSVPAPWSFHLVRTDRDGRVSAVSSARESRLRVNGGFFAMRREIFDHLGPGEDLVTEVFPRLVAQGSLHGYEHDGFWASMDTPADWRALTELDARGDAPWKVWDHGSDAEAHAEGPRTPGATRHASRVEAGR
jgi:glucose-1-phosphate cytidylyltransferase